MRSSINWKWALCAAALLVWAAGCEGTEGPAGATGPAGPAGADGADGADGEDGADGVMGSNGADGQDGEDGEDGEDGADYEQLGYVGMDECEACHEEQFNQVIRSGHPYKLTTTYGLPPDQRPEFPGVNAVNPPDGYDWADVSYVIGGATWKQRFIDNDGFIITSGAAENLVQYNIADGSWATYHTQDEPGTKPYTCGVCHNTAYSPDGNQDGLPGMIGTWAENGVTCEECHGPGGNHLVDPYLVDMRIDRDSESCGACHIRGSASAIPASNGFTRHHEQWNEIAATKHRALDCVDCHNPHQSAVYTDPDWNPNGSIISACTDCHFQEATVMNTVGMLTLDCIDCHMPKIAKSAIGNLDNFIGDVAGHLFAINTDPAAEQFYNSGGNTSPFLTLDYACRHCHKTDGSGPGFVKTDDELAASALGFHTP